MSIHYTIEDLNGSLITGPGKTPSHFNNLPHASGSTTFNFKICHPNVYGRLEARHKKYVVGNDSNQLLLSHLMKYKQSSTHWITFSDWPLEIPSSTRKRTVS